MSKHRSQRYRWRSAYTLVELLIASAAATILMGGMAGSIFIATKAFDDSGSKPNQVTHAANVADHIMSEMQYATIFVERTANAVTFKVPDRNGDGSEETLRYAWSGVAGDPLTKKLNDSPPAVLLSSVQNLNLSYLTRTIGPPPPPPLIESAEQLLIFHDDAPGGTMKSININSVTSCAQYFKPILPFNAVSWKLTRVRFEGESHGASTGTLNVHIDSATAFLKPDKIIESQFVNEALLAGAGAWTEVAFSGVEGIDPNTGLCLVISASSSGAAGSITYEEGGTPMTSSTNFLSSSAGGTKWSEPDETRDLRFYVFGTITTSQ